MLAINLKIVSREHTSRTQYPQQFFGVLHLLGDIGVPTVTQYPKCHSWLGWEVSVFPMWLNIGIQGAEREEAIMLRNKTCMGCAGTGIPGRKPWFSCWFPESGSNTLCRLLSSLPPSTLTL